MAGLQATAFRLAIMIVAINIMIYVANVGYISESDMQQTSRFLRNVNINDVQAADFQTDKIISTDSNQSIGNYTGETTSSKILDFVQLVPIVGPIVGIFRILYEVLVMATFGVVILMLKMQFPHVVIIPVAIINTMIFIIALYEHIIDFIAKRGGAK